MHQSSDLSASITTMKAHSSVMPHPSTNESDGVASVGGSELKLRAWNNKKSEVRADLESGPSSLLLHRMHTHITHESQISGAIDSFGVVDCLIDPWRYDIETEADEHSHFQVVTFIEDFLIALLHPLSLVYVYMRYGLIGLQVRSFFPPSRPRQTPATSSTDTSSESRNSSSGGTSESESKINSMFEDPDKPKWTFGAMQFFSASILVMLLRFTWIVSFLLSKSHSLGNTITASVGMSRAPIYAFSMTSLTTVLLLLSLSNKKAYRKKASFNRMLLHRERRMEELFFGWLPLPWQLAAFELRMAALKTGNVDLSRKRFTFASCNEEQLRAALGEKVLGYIEMDGSRATSANIIDGNVEIGAQCTAMAMLLRITLDKSFANPAFGPDASGLYLSQHFSNTWLLYACAMISAPYWVAHGFQNGGSYDVAGVISCITSAIITFQVVVPNPQGITYSAILSVKRRKDMLSFLNSLLMSQSDHIDEGLIKETTSLKHAEDWPYSIDMSHAANMSVWRICRDIVFEFGANYRLRTDANGAIMIMYVLVLTLFLLLVSILVPEKVSFYDYAFPVVFHVLMLIPMSFFAIALAYEGDHCAAEIDLSSSTLANAMLRIEEKFANLNRGLTARESQRLLGARSAASSLQTSLATSKHLHPVQILNMLTLDRALIFTVLFGLFTQFTCILNVLSVVK
jgi:hypothetical protein